MALIWIVWPAAFLPRFQSLGADGPVKSERHCEPLRYERGEEPETKQLPAERLSAADVVKIDALQGSIRRQLVRYGFNTFGAADFTVSEDTYRPEKEGFEIGFELSASDSIRLKWAYQLGLLDVAKVEDANHPGLVVFDEPRQQEAASASVAGLVSEAGRIASWGKQILIATSEDLESVRRFVANVDHKLIEFGGRIIDRIKDEA